jgi:RNA polymerase sigma-B factor
VPRSLQELAVRIEHVTETLSAQLGRAPMPTELAGTLGESIEGVLDALASRTAHHPIALERPSRDAEDETSHSLAAVDEPGFSLAEDAATLDRLLGLPPDRERVILTLRFREDLLQREIGSLLGISQMQVSRSLAKASRRSNG